MDQELSTVEPNLSIEEVTSEMRKRALRSLFFFCKAGLGYRDLHPIFHKRITDFITNTTQKRKGLQISRGHLKTSVGTKGDSMHKGFNFLCKDESDEFDYPLLIAMSTASNAERVSTQIERDFDNAQALRWWFPDIVRGPEWSRKVRQFDRVVNGVSVRRFTIEFIGVGGKVSSRHFRGLKLDDLHAVEEAMESDLSVEDVVDWYKHTDSLLIEPEHDFIDIIGTPCSMNPPDVYTYIRDKEGSTYDWLVQGCYDGSGKPVWPERFPTHVLEAIRRKMGDEVFAYTYLVNPIDRSVAEFDGRWFPRYHVSSPLGPDVYMLGDGRKILATQMFTTATVDLAGCRSTKGDPNSILVLGRTANEMNIIRDTWKKRCPPDELIDTIVEKHKRFNFPFVGIEEVGYQETLSYWLEKRIIADKLSLTVVPVKPHGAHKESRTRALQPMMKAGQFAIADNDVLLLDEIIRWPKGEDHLLDCLAYQPQLWRMPSFNDDPEQFEKDCYNDYLRECGQMGAVQ
jgi:hypothetical protein